MSFRPTPVRVFGTRIGAAVPRIGMPYVYRGDLPLDMDPDIAKPRPRRSKAVCGTPAGYKRHVNEGTPKCRPCTDAQAEKLREYRSRA